MSIKMIERILHYTSLKNWRKIQRDGVLKPLSAPFFLSKERKSFERSLNAGLTLDEIASVFQVPEYLLISEKAKAIIQKDATYLTGIPAESMSSWEHEKGLIGELELHILNKMKRGEKNIVVLEIPVLNPEGSFVRDHKPINPKNWYSAADRRSQQHLRQEYLNSSIPLADYQGKFRVPEAWLLQKTPLDCIKVKEQYRKPLQEAKNAVEAIKNEARSNMWTGFF